MRLSGFRCFASFLLLLGVTASGFGQAEGAAAAPLPTLRLQTRLVLLDTSVTDSKGQPVSGLTAKDFMVYEDKVAQPIVTFDAPAAHTLPAADTQSTHFDPAHPAEFGSSPVNLLVLDEVNTHFADSVYAVHALEQYLLKRPETLTEPTALLVVRDSRFEQLVPFTLNRALLLQALKAHVPEQAWQLEQSLSAGEGVGVRLDNSLAALEQLVQYSARIPGHKNIVWVGAGFPTPDRDALGPQTDTTLKGMLQHVTDVLLDARASLYAIDPTTTAAGMVEITDPVTLEFALFGGIESTAIDPYDKSLNFDQLGPMTGGRVIRGSNDVSGLVATSIAAGSVYYTLGYRPHNGDEAPGRFHHIRVVCLRPGLTAVTHDGYYSTASNTTLTKDVIGYDLNNAATASLPLNAVAFTVDRDANGFVLHARSSDLSWAAENDAQKARVEVLVVALSARGAIVGHSLQSETASTASGMDVRAPEQRVRFTAPDVSVRQATRLRFVVRDEHSGRMGTFDLPAK